MDGFLQLKYHSFQLSKPDLIHLMNAVLYFLKLKFSKRIKYCTVKLIRCKSQWKEVNVSNQSISAGNIFHSIIILKIIIFNKSLLPPQYKNYSEMLDIMQNIAYTWKHILRIADAHCGCSCMETYTKGISFQIANAKSRKHIHCFYIALSLPPP